MRAIQILRATACEAAYVAGYSAAALVGALLLESALIALLGP